MKTRFLSKIAFSLTICYFRLSNQRDAADLVATVRLVVGQAATPTP